jgi:hypothetical protein
VNLQITVLAHDNFGQWWRNPTCRTQPINKVKGLRFRTQREVNATLFVFEIFAFLVIRGLYIPGSFIDASLGWMAFSCGIQSPTGTPLLKPLLHVLTRNVVTPAILVFHLGKCNISTIGLQCVQSSPKMLFGGHPR